MVLSAAQMNGECVLCEGEAWHRRARLQEGIGCQECLFHASCAPLGIVLQRQG